MQAAVLCVLALTGAIAAWQLYALGLVQGVAVALDAPARHTLVFQIVGRDDLTNAVALSSSLGTTARIVGPGARRPRRRRGRPRRRLRAERGQLRDRDLRHPRHPARSAAAAGRPTRSVLAGVGEALRFAVSSRRVAVTFFTVLLVRTFSFNFDVLLPLVAKLDARPGAGTFGLIASVFGGGALCGALILATVGGRRLLLVLGGALGFGTSQLLLAPQDALPAVCALLFVDRDLLHPMGIELARDAHARCARAPARARGEPVLLRVHGRRAARRPDRGSLTAHGGTRLAFAVAGTIAVLVAATGATVPVPGPPARDAHADHEEVEA